MTDRAVQKCPYKLVSKPDSHVASFPCSTLLLLLLLLVIWLLLNRPTQPKLN